MSYRDSDGKELLKCKSQDADIGGGDYLLQRRFSEINRVQSEGVTFGSKCTPCKSFYLQKQSMSRFLKDGRFDLFFGVFSISKWYHYVGKKSKLTLEKTLEHYIDSEQKNYYYSIKYINIVL